MHCPLENLDFQADSCPVHRCIYREASQGRCQHKELTREINAERVAELKGINLYRIKEEAQLGKYRLSVGLIIDKYAAFIVESFPNKSQSKFVPSTEHNVERIMRKVFHLSPDQQMQFWSRSRFDSWRKHKRVDMEIDLADVYRLLKKVAV